MTKIIFNVSVAVVLIVMSVSCAYTENADVEFGIYILEDGELVLSDKHIESYNKKSHKIGLNEKGAQKWKSYILYDESFDPPIPKLGGLYGKEFIIKLHGKGIYKGKFYSSSSSMFENGVLLYDTMLLGENNTLKVEFRPQEMSDEDPRSNKALMNYFQQKGILE